ncbi:MAG: GTPase [Thermoprotei archaeon]|nr:MAG: GTPase [Thermoprotei archaeon]
MYFIYVLGPAGSGKTSLTSTFSEWLKAQKMDVAIVNLDPAVEWVPYTPTADIRDYITTWDVMRKYNLGPNGALIASVDLSVNHVYKLRSEIEKEQPNYVIVDTPGQLEIFAFRPAGKLLIEQLSGDSKSLALFLIDAYFTSKPSALASLLLLSVATTFSHGLPQINVLTKIDMLSPELYKKVLKWLEDPMIFISDITRDKLPKPYEELAYETPEFLTSIVEELIPISSVTWEGMESLYAAVQRVLAGGEDYLTEEYSEV